MGMAAKIVFFPVGNGDMTLVNLRLRVRPSGGPSSDESAWRPSRIHWPSWLPISAASSCR
jgi:hypothetical protein